MTGTIKQRLRRLLFATFLVTLGDSAMALGLGEATVRSYLQQPLEMHLKLISRSEAELASVTAKLASAKDFQVIGLNRGALGVPLEFEVITDPNNPFIRVTSRQTVTDPILQILVEVTWASGRMLRQYTVFLDPPTFASPAPLPAPAREAPQITAVPSPQTSTIDETLTEPEQASPPPVSDRVEMPEQRPEPPAAEPFVQDSAPASIAADEPAPELPAESSPQDAAEASIDPDAAARRAANFGTGPDFQDEETNDAPAAEVLAESTPESETVELAQTTPPSEPPAPVEDAGVDAAPDANTDLGEAQQQAALDASDEAAVLTESAPNDPVPEPATDLAEESTDLEESLVAAEAVVQSPDSGEAEATGLAVDDALPEEDIAVPDAVADTDAAVADEDSLAMEAGSEAPLDAPIEPVAIEPELAAEELPDPQATLADGTMSASETTDPATDIETAVAEPPQSETAVEAVAEAPVEPEPEAQVVRSQPQAYRAVIPDTPSGESVTVARGDTLWEIANDWRDGRDYSVNQVMLAIQQQNPQAFNKGNINSLRSGAILRMPSEPQIDRLSSRQAMLEVMRQEDAYRNRWNDLPEPPSIPALAEAAQETDPLADSTAGAESSEDPVAAEAAIDEALDAEPAIDTDTAVAVEEAPRLELVPPSALNADSGSGLGEGNNGGAGVSEGQSVVEELARAQEDLVNAQQENEYLAERIAELEAELQRRDTEPETGVTDTGLAEMEDRLEAQRLDPDQPEEDLPIVAPSEDPWYGRMLWWLIALLVVSVAAVIWWLRSRPSIDEQVEAEMAALAEEANDVIRVLGAEEDNNESTEPEASEEAKSSIDPEADADTRTMPDEDDPEPDLEATVLDLRSFKPPAPPVEGEEAVELDSEDPETKLDLARAYLSMGDTDAARRMLEDVLNTGSEEQAAEARGMMDEL